MNNRCLVWVTWSWIRFSKSQNFILNYVTRRPVLMWWLAWRRYNDTITSRANRIWNVYDGLSVSSCAAYCTTAIGITAWSMLCFSPRSARLSRGLLLYSQCEKSCLAPLTPASLHSRSEHWKCPHTTAPSVNKTGSAQNAVVRPFPVSPLWTVFCFVLVRFLIFACTFYIETHIFL